MNEGKRQVWLVWGWRVAMTVLVPLSLFGANQMRRADLAEIHNRQQAILSYYQSKIEFAEWEHKHADWSAQVIKNMDSRITALEGDREILVEIRTAIARIEARLEPLLKAPR